MRLNFRLACETLDALKAESIRRTLGVGITFLVDT